MHKKILSVLVVGCVLGWGGQAVAATKAFVPDASGIGTKSTVGGVSGDEAATMAILTCPSKRIEYIPIPPLVAGGYTDIEIDESTQKAVRKLKNWPTSDPVKVNELLTNISTNITHSSKTLSGSIGGLFSASHSTKQYVVDFMKWRAEPLDDLSGTNYGWVRAGVGLRLIIDITNGDAQIGGSLLALAASAKAGDIDGSISVELIGIDSSEVTLSMPFTVDLSEDNIQKVIEALAIVKAKLYDKTTRVQPSLIARMECAKEEKKPKDSDESGNANRVNYWSD